MYGPLCGPYGNWSYCRGSETAWDSAQQCVERASAVVGVFFCECFPCLVVQVALDVVHDDTRIRDLFYTSWDHVVSTQPPYGQSRGVSGRRNAGLFVQ